MCKNNMDLTDWKKYVKNNILTATFLSYKITNFDGLEMLANLTEINLSNL